VFYCAVTKIILSYLLGVNFFKKY